MKVLHVIPGVAMRYGGPSAAALAMCRALRAAGHDPMIATTDADGPDRLPLELETPIEYEGVPVVFFRRVWSESLKYSPRLSRWLAQHISEFDVVHVHALMSHACVAAARVAAAAGVPYVLRPLGTLDEWSLGQKPAKKRLFMASVGRSMLAGAAAVHATSPEEAASVTRAWPEARVVLIPLGVDEAAFSGEWRPVDPPYVATVSRIHPVKALDVLVDAFAAATAGGERAAWRLVIAGSGDPEHVAALTTHIRQSPAADRVTMAGWVDGGAKERLLSGASLFALTSRHENFGVGLAEAMAMGVPVLVTRGVHLSPLVEAAGAGWVTPLESAEIDATLRVAMDDLAARHARGAAARRLAEQWRWPAIAQQLIDLYRRIGRAGADLCVALQA
jgi:glycosyltransferase involved in cell wall biosynthesis